MEINLKWMLYFPRSTYQYIYISSCPKVHKALTFSFHTLKFAAVPWQLPMTATHCPSSVQELFSKLIVIIGCPDSNDNNFNLSTIFWQWCIFSFLAGEGAFQWAMEHGLATCHDEDLITGDFAISCSYAECY